MSTNENAPVPAGAKYEAKLNANYTPTASRIPAYMRQLMNLRLAGKMPRGVVIVTFSWEIGKAYSRVVIADNPPADQLILWPLSGLHVKIVYYGRDSHRVGSLADAVLKTNPASLITFGMDLIDTGNAVSIIKAPELPQREAA